MNKNLDHLFEQARKSMQSEMPLEEVQQLIHAQASPSLWTNQKIWIMSTSIIGIITIGIVCWFNPSNTPTPISETETTTKPPRVAEHHISAPTPPNTIVLQDAIPDNIPLPIITKVDHSSTPIQPIQLTSLEQTPEIPLLAQKVDFLDSLGPKKTFTEYTLEIRKENSEQEIQKLKTELANYGIHMDVKILNYDNNNKIKRFKGQFKTDSLFCGSSMNNYEFDISGSFKSMEFIFRVAENKNLKYLKIQSENFEETIECYDDEVISSTQEARKLRHQMHEEMARAQREMANAQQEMANAQVEIARAREEVARLRHREHSKARMRELERLEKVDWDKIEADIEKAMQEVELEDIDDEIKDALDDLDVIILDKNFKDDMKALQKDLARMRIDLDREVREKLKERLHNHNRTRVYTVPSPDEPVIIVEKEKAPAAPKLEKRTAKELKEEAKAMEEAAKKLQKEAKERRKLAKKKAKEK